MLSICKTDFFLAHKKFVALVQENFETPVLQRFQGLMTQSYPRNGIVVSKHIICYIRWAGWALWLPNSTYLSLPDPQWAFLNACPLFLMK